MSVESLQMSLVAVSEADALCRTVSLLARPAVQSRMAQRHPVAGPHAAPDQTFDRGCNGGRRLRDTVVVGVVGASGLGVLLEQQRATFDYAEMTTTVIALVVVSLLVDACSAAIGQSMR